MRTVTFDAISEAEGNELLTTGEAARLLNSSRQHVVDLCDRGDLPFATVGTHRRVRRSDVEALRTRTQTMTRDQKRSLWLAYAVAGRIVAGPEHALQAARNKLESMRRSSRGQTQRWLDEWGRLLDGAPDKLLSALTSRSPKGRELRQNTPFAGILTKEEREDVLRAWRRCQGSG